MKTIIILLLLLLCNVESFKLKNVLRRIPQVIKEFAKETWRGFKKGPTPSTSEWGREKIISAEHVGRPMEGNILKNFPIDHHGILLHTSNGNDWLLHNTPDSGVVITDAGHMSSKWDARYSIDVTGDKTVSEALRSAGSSSFGENRCGYEKGGTCIGTAKKVEKYLRK